MTAQRTARSELRCVRGIVTGGVSAALVGESAYQLTSQNYGTANTPQTHPTWVDLNGLGPGQPPQYILNIADLGQILKALQGAQWTTDPGNLNPGSCP